MTGWFANDDLFRRELEEGHRWAGHVVEALKAQHVEASLTPMAWRETIEDRHEFAGERDIEVVCKRGTLLLEAKSRRLRFTDDPSSYPYPTALVDTVSGWDQKPEVPLAVVIVSQNTGSMLVVPVRNSRSKWTIKVTRDRVRNIEDRWYECPRQHLRTFDELVAWLKMPKQ